MSAGDLLALGMLPAACLVLLSGYPAAFVLGGLAILFAVAGALVGSFDLVLLQGTSLRIFGLMANATLIALPLFVFMGVTLERAQLARGLLLATARLIGNRPGGLSMSIVICGGLMAASTGVAGASIMTLGLIGFPVMLQAGYSKWLTSGVIAASGTLGQLIPPSIALLILADTMSASHQEVQLALGNFAPDPISVVDLFAAALVPGLLLVMLYLVGLWLMAWWQPLAQPPLKAQCGGGWLSEALPLGLLILGVLGSIFTGIAAPSEGAALGAAGSVLLAIAYNRLDWLMLKAVAYKTVVITGMIFLLIIGASMFSLVFRELGGSELITGILHGLPGGVMTALLVGMAVVFILGFFLEFIEIVVLIVPLLATPLLALGVDPIWLAVLIAINLQTSFLTPPLGVALFYLRSVAPPSISMLDIYLGAMPFIGLQLLLLACVVAFPQLATLLPQWLNG